MGIGAMETEKAKPALLQMVFYDRKRSGLETVDTSDKKDNALL